jgi:anti-sigma B factor antagonist
MTVRVLFVEEGIWCVTPAGRMDVVSARSLEEALNGLLDAAKGRIVVDLSETSFIASGGLKVLLSALRRARAFGGDLHLAAMNDRVREIFDISGFVELFEIYPSVEEAARSLKPA